MLPTHERARALRLRGGAVNGLDLLALVALLLLCALAYDQHRRLEAALLRERFLRDRVAGLEGLAMHWRDSFHERQARVADLEARR